MLREISFFLPVTPFGKGRARTFTKDKIAQTITPTKTKLNAKELDFYTRWELKKQGFKTPFDGPVSVDYCFYVPRPKSVKTRIYPTVRPDDDNILKQVNDVFNTLVWIDDTQRVNGTMQKRYADSEHPVGIYVKVTQLLTREENEGKTCKQISEKSLKQPSLTTNNLKGKVS